MASPSPSHRDRETKHGASSDISSGGGAGPSHRDVAGPSRGAVRHREGSHIPTSPTSGRQASPSYRDVVDFSRGASLTHQDEAGHFHTNEESPNTRYFRNSLILLLE